MNNLSQVSQYLEDLTLSLDQIGTLVTVISNSDLAELKPNVLSNYFWIVNDSVVTAKNICARALGAILVTAIA